MKNACILLLLVLPLLVACHHQRRDTAWQQAQTAPHLDIPDTMDAPGRSAEMMIPAVSADIPGSVHGDARPPVNVILTSAEDPAAAWGLVTTRIDAAGIGQQLVRDDAGHQLALSIDTAELPEQHRGFFGRIFGSREERRKQEHFVAVAVHFINGETRVSVDGDGRAALYLGSVLEGPGLHNIAADEEAIAVDMPRPVLGPPTGAPASRDASGR